MQSHNSTRAFNIWYDLFHQQQYYLIFKKVVDFDKFARSVFLVFFFLGMSSEFLRGGWGFAKRINVYFAVLCVYKYWNANIPYCTATPFSPPTMSSVTLSRGLVTWDYYQFMNTGTYGWFAAARFKQSFLTGLRLLQLIWFSNRNQIFISLAL